MSSLKLFHMSPLLLRMVVAFTLVLGGATHGLAKDGSGGNGGSGSGNSGSGSGNSGSGSGDDDGDDNSGDDDHDDDNDDGGDVKDLDKIRDAVSAGQAASLSRLLAHLQRHYPGKVLSIDLQRKSGVYTYRVKILTSKGRITSVRLNARTLERIT